MTVIGPLQQRILDQLDTPDPYPLTTAELAAELLGSTDRETVRRVRRAVDGLAARGLVRTWTDRRNLWQGDPPRWWSDEAREKHRDAYRSYIKPAGWDRQPCVGEGCRLCALGDTPTEGTFWRPVDGRCSGLVHHSRIVDAFKSRVRWVERVAPPSTSGEGGES
jgi:hypothetical protein